MKPQSRETVFVVLNPWKRISDASGETNIIHRVHTCATDHQYKREKLSEKNGHADRKRIQRFVVVVHLSNNTECRDDCKDVGARTGELVLALERQLDCYVETFDGHHRDRADDGDM